MKTLILVRHAKSSWNHPGLADFDRPLNQRGEHDAPDMGARLGAAFGAPDVVLASPAVRARETALALADGVGIRHDDLQLEGGLYGASGAEMASMIRRFDDAWQSAAIVGHNPGMTDLANRFTGRYIDNLPTSGVVIIRFEVDGWKDIAERGGSLVSFDYPKKHRRE